MLCYEGTMHTVQSFWLFQCIVETLINLTSLGSVLFALLIYMKSDRMECCRADFSLSFCSSRVLDDWCSGRQAHISSSYSQTCVLSMFTVCDSGHISVIRCRKQLSWHPVASKQYNLGLFWKTCCVSTLPAEAHGNSGWMQIQLHSFQTTADLNPERCEGWQTNHM